MIEPQRIDFVVVPTQDQERAVAFYGETLGFERNLNASEDFPEFETGNVTLMIVDPSKFDIPFTPLPPGGIAIRVHDVEAARTKLEEAGVEFRGKTFDSGVCHEAFFQDPDGNGLLLHRRYAPFPDGTRP